MLWAPLCSANKWQICLSHLFSEISAMSMVRTRETGLEVTVSHDPHVAWMSISYTLINKLETFKYAPSKTVKLQHIKRKTSTLTESHLDHIHHYLPFSQCFCTTKISVRNISRQNIFHWLTDWNWSSRIILLFWNYHWPN